MKSPTPDYKYKPIPIQSSSHLNNSEIIIVVVIKCLLLKGLEALKEHFKNSKFPCEGQEYMPVVFSPPRDGKTLTDPVPIVGRSLLVSSMEEEEESNVDIGEENGYSMKDGGGGSGGGDCGDLGGNDDDDG